MRNALAIKTVGIIFWGHGFGLTEANDAFLTMTGFSREEALGKTWQELTPQEFHPASLKAVEQVMTLGEATPYEKEYLRKDGSRWWGLFAPRKVGNEVVEFVLDVTDRRRAEAALRESEARFRTVANLVPDFLWSSNPAGQATWFNERWCTYTGQSSEQARDYGWLDRVHPDDRERCLADLRSAIEKGEAARGEYRIRSVEGQYRWFLSRAEAIRDETGRATQTFGAVADVHDLRQLQLREGRDPGPLCGRTPLREAHRGRSERRGADCLNAVENRVTTGSERSRTGRWSAYRSRCEAAGMRIANPSCP
ncbi:PAS domain-containing protein [Methylobacterium sp. P31]